MKLTHRLLPFALALLSVQALGQDDQDPADEPITDVASRVPS